MCAHTHASLLAVSQTQAASIMFYRVFLTDLDLAKWARLAGQQAIKDSRVSAFPVLGSQVYTIILWHFVAWIMGIKFRSLWFHGKDFRAMSPDPHSSFLYIILLHLYNNFPLLVDAMIVPLFKWNSWHEDRLNDLRKFTECSKWQDQLMNCRQISTQCFHHPVEHLPKHLGCGFRGSRYCGKMWQSKGVCSTSSQKQSKVRKETGQRHTPVAYFCQPVPHFSPPSSPIQILNATIW